MKLLILTVLLLGVVVICSAPPPPRRPPSPRGKDAHPRHHEEDHTEAPDHNEEDHTGEPNHDEDHPEALNPGGRIFPKKKGRKEEPRHKEDYTAAPHLKNFTEGQRDFPGRRLFGKGLDKKEHNKDHFKKDHTEAHEDYTKAPSRQDRRAEGRKKDHEDGPRSREDHTEPPLYGLGRGGLKKGKGSRP